MIGKWAGYALTLLLCILLVGCGNGDTTTTPATPPSDEEPRIDSPAVETPIGVLALPESWGKDVQVETSNVNDLYTAVFSATAGDEKVQLFALLVGAEGSGYQLGNVADKNGAQQTVWLDISPLEPDTSWTEDDITRLNTLQEGVNDLIYQINQIDGFQAAS